MRRCETKCRQNLPRWLRESVLRDLRRRTEAGRSCLVFHYRGCSGFIDANAMVLHGDSPSICADRSVTDAPRGQRNLYFAFNL
jgi:hypothetical protein